MADEKQTEQDVAVTEPLATGKSSLVMLVGFIGVVLIVETVLFFLMVPSAEEVAAMAETQLINNVQAGVEDDAMKAKVDEKVIEFPLGVFGETFSPIGTERQYSVEFRLKATLQAKNEENLKTQFAEKEGRLQHSIRMVIRNSRLEELQDNQLGLIERRILATCNNLFEEPYLLTILLTQYRVREE